MKIKVKNLAKIKEAEIELKPLTVFVGKNGTQKSYMAHVVYETAKFLTNFSQERISLFRTFYENSSELMEYLNQLIGKELKDNNENLVVNKKDLEDIILKIFSEYNKIITKAVIKSLNTTEKFGKFSVEILFNFDNNIFKKLEIPTKDHTNLLVGMLEKNIKGRFSNQFLKLLFKINPFITKVINTNRYTVNEVFYFPASRTGFVLAFDEIIAGIISERFVGTKKTAKLTQPVIDFLLNFLDIKNNKLNHGSMPVHLQDLVEFIRKRLLHGEIIEDREENKYLKFYFQPANTKKKLEIHVTSSSTIELLPIVEFLKSFKNLKGNLLIIEEPEAHLHPEAQIEMARFLSLLVNKGARVLITTHSDYIIHEISNCIKLSNVPEKEKIEFLKKKRLEKFPEIAISKDKVGVYLFKEIKTKTKVERMKIDKFGIEDKNFEDVLDELLEDTNILGEYLID